MAVQWNRQYRPVSTSETGTDDGLSIRGVRDLSDSINNYGRHFCSKFVSEMCIPPWGTADSNDTNENVLAMWAPFLAPDGPNKLRVTVSYQRITGAGDVSINLYCSRWLYNGDVILDASFLSPVYGSCAFTCDSDAWEIGVSSMIIPHDPGERRNCWILITGQNTNGSRAQIGSVDITPKYI